MHEYLSTACLHDRHGEVDDGLDYLVTRFPDIPPHTTVKDEA